jgi:hypothetical protein
MDGHDREPHRVTHALARATLSKNVKKLSTPSWAPGAPMAA